MDLQPKLAAVRTLRTLTLPQKRTILLQCKPTEKLKSSTESSLSNLLRHYERCHKFVSQQFKEVYYVKSVKRSNVSADGGNSSKQQKISPLFFRSNCTQEQLNDSIVDHIIDTMGPFTLGIIYSFCQ